MFVLFFFLKSVRSFFFEECSLCFEECSLCFEECSLCFEECVFFFEHDQMTGCYTKQSFAVKLTESI